MNNTVKRRRNRRQLAYEGNLRENIITLDIRRGFVYNLAKFVLGWNLLQQGKHILTDCIFKQGKKTDVYDVDDAIAYNILYTEAMEETGQIEGSAYPVTVQPLSGRRIIEDGLKSLLPSTWGLNPERKRK